MAIAQEWMARNAAPICFLGSYFVLVVLGNMIYATPAGSYFLGVTGFSTAPLDFETSFTFGFWALLLMPFVVTPPVVWLTRRTVGRWVAKFSGVIPEFRTADYLVICGIFYSVVLLAFIRADAFSLAFGGGNALDAVTARFTLLNRFNFFEIVVLQSLLMYMAFYAVIRALRSRHPFWITVAMVHIVLMTIFLVALLMKWPVLVFYIGVLATLFIFPTNKHPFIVVGAGLAVIMIAYLLIATQVFRMAETPEVPITISASTDTPAHTTKRAGEDGERQAESSADIPQYVANLAATSVRLAPVLLAHATNRMAAVYPYYFHIFTTEGPICGNAIEQIQTRDHVLCRPSYLVYARMFQDDGFEDQGTAPAAVHISAYALGGWPLATGALVLASAILGLFASIPLGSTATASAFSVVGVVAGYHFSQLPGEGPILYDHGFFWAFLLIVLYTAYRATSEWLTRPKRLST